MSAILVFVPGFAKQVKLSTYTAKPRHTTCQPNLHTPKDQIGIPTCALLHTWHREVPAQRWRPQKRRHSNTGHPWAHIPEPNPSNILARAKIASLRRAPPKKLRGEALWLLGYFSCSSGGTLLPSFGCTFPHWDQSNPPGQPTFRTIDPRPSSKTCHEPDESWREPRCTTRPQGIHRTAASVTITKERKIFPGSVFLANDKRVECRQPQHSLAWPKRKPNWSRQQDHQRHILARAKILTTHDSCMKMVSYSHRSWREPRIRHSARPPWRKTCNLQDKTR